MSNYIRYTPLNKSEFSNSGAAQRIIKITEVQQDPLGKQIWLMQC